VGSEGKLGGQARVPGAAGVWRDLTANVNQLAANLTTQVRAIADVATAVTKGDLTRSIAVEAQGEVAELKDNINEMIRNLRDSTRKNMEQDWLKTNLAKFSRMLQGQRDLAAVSKLILSDLAPLVTAHHGVFYVMDSAGDTPALKLLASYAYKERANLATEFKLGEGLVGQVAQDRRMLTIGQVPAAPGTLAWPPSLPSTPTSRATVVTWSAKVARVSIMPLMVSARVAISPFTSTRSSCFRSPLATAVTTLAMPRTWLVKVLAMLFWLSVRC
jgi:HAMP domain-containing protein